MALSSKHPCYDTHYRDWHIMRDAFAGERKIKDAGLTYLPATELMLNRGMGAAILGNSSNLTRNVGLRMYEAYKLRAVYHEIVKPALEAMVGVMHRKPAEIKVPKRMEPMLERATFNGENMQTLLQRINEQQLLMGNQGLMLDVATGAKADAVPYIVSYSVESIFNWDTTKVSDDSGPRALQFVVLNESGYERTQGLTWNQVTKYRVLAMADQCDDIFPGIGQLGPVYVAGAVSAKEEINAADFHKVELAGRTLESIPFVTIGPRDLVPEPDAPVLLPLARIALAIYRGEADYRQSLFMQGQQTLVTIGAVVQAAGAAPDQGIEVGANASIELPIGGNAKYIGASADGLEELAKAIQEDKRQAAHLGANLLDQRGSDAESGDALHIRSAARTSSLTTVAKTGAAGLEQLLKQAAQFMGENPKDVSVAPNLDFSDAETTAQDLVQLMTAKMLGAPISKRTVHWWMTQKDFTNLSYEDEQDEIDEEGPDEATGGTPGLAGTPGAKPGAPQNNPNDKKPVLKTKTPPKK